MIMKHASVWRSAKSMKNGSSKTKCPYRDPITDVPNHNQYDAVFALGFFFHRSFIVGKYAAKEIMLLTPKSAVIVVSNVSSMKNLKANHR
jgi:hypothetical protein